MNTPVKEHTTVTTRELRNLLTSYTSNGLITGTHNQGVIDKALAYHYIAQVAPGRYVITVEGMAAKERLG